MKLQYPINEEKVTLLNASVNRKFVVFIGDSLPECIKDLEKEFILVHILGESGAIRWMKKHSGKKLEAVFLDQNVTGMKILHFTKILKEQLLWDFIPLFVIAHHQDSDLTSLGRQYHIDEVLLSEELNLNMLIDKIKLHQNLLKERFETNPMALLNSNKIYHTPTPKRIFDILVSAALLMLLSPLFLIVALVIYLESPGPVFYTSKRVGSGYKIIDFIKFRSMFMNADSKLKDLKNLNQYSKQSKVEMPEDEEGLGVLYKDTQGIRLYGDGEMIISEKAHLVKKKADNAGTFIKIDNDPRVTKVGKFIRNTSIDELPQLFNVLRGDMSIVGNRPLPLYEAEQLTTDAWLARFLAPAGITGLWQVTKRGSSNMSEEERKQLDNTYALKGNFWFDLKILFMTVPALLQKENV